MRKQRMKCTSCDSFNVTTTSNYERKTIYSLDSNPKTTLRQDYAGAKGILCRDCGLLEEL